MGRDHLPVDHKMTEVSQAMMFWLRSAHGGGIGKLRVVRFGLGESLGPTSPDNGNAPSHSPWACCIRIVVAILSAMLAVKRRSGAGLAMVWPSSTKVSWGERPRNAVFQRVIAGLVPKRQRDIGAARNTAQPSSSLNR